MRRRLFDDLVVSRTGTARAPFFRALPLSLAVHGLAMAALAALSITAVTETPVRAGPIVFPWSGQAHAATATRSPHGAVARPSRRLETRPVPLDPPRTAVGASDVPPLDVETGVEDGPVDDVPVCLTGCAPGDPGGGNHNRGLAGPGGTGEGTGSPRPVGGDIQEPRRIRGAVPVYPDLARRAHIEGIVELECVIDTDGRVTQLRVVSGNPLLAEAAMAAVRSWVYTPTTLNGQPIRVILAVTVKFALARS